MIEDNEDATQAKFPFVIPLIMILLPMMVGGAFLKSDLSLGAPDSDDRTAEAMCRDYNNYLKRQNTNWGVMPDCAKQVTCQMKRMGFWDEEGNLVEETVHLPVKAGVDAKLYGTYLWYPNLNNHSLAYRRQLVIEKFRELRLHKNFKDTVQWFSDGFEVFKEQHPDIPESKLFEAYVDDFLSAPLECPRWTNKKCMRVWDGTSKEGDEGRICLLNAHLAEQVTLANQKLFDAKKVEMIPKVCLRSNQHESAIFVSNNRVGCSLDDSGKNFRMAGNSHHEIGLAFDLVNQKQAEPYLADVGIACGFIKDDKGHCSIAEENLDKILAGWLRRAGRWGRKWMGRYRKGKEIYNTVRGK